MRRMQTIEKVIGENTFYIRPFGAFAAANISGELAALLSPILAGIAPLFGGLDTGDGGSDAAANPLDMDIEEAMPAISSALSTISGDKGTVEAALDGRPLCVAYSVSSPEPVCSSHSRLLDSLPKPRDAGLAGHAASELNTMPPFRSLIRIGNIPSPV